jgi:hypothetical protein
LACQQTGMDARWPSALHPLLGSIRCKVIGARPSKAASRINPSALAEAPMYRGEVEGPSLELMGPSAKTIIHSILDIAHESRRRRCTPRRSVRQEIRMHPGPAARLPRDRLRARLSTVAPGACGVLLPWSRSWRHRAMRRRGSRVVTCRPVPSIALGAHTAVGTIGAHGLLVGFKAQGSIEGAGIHRNSGGQRTLEHSRVMT